ncbi:MAG: hypothetical protein U0V87_11705 [Acidobacteriota bacterium]
MNRKPIRILSLLAAVPVLLFAAATSSSAMECSPRPADSNRLYSIEVLVDGRARPEYLSRGTTYIEALDQREYAIRLTNHSPERIAVALSVDGLNSIDAKTSSMRDARKWILDPYASIVIDGWQTSSRTARKFFFTREESSYGAWLGKTENLGVIAAAFFRERIAEECLRAPRFEQRDQAPAAPMGSADSQARSQSKRERERKDDKLAATGIGRELSHPVTRIEFDHENSPAAVISLRYEYRDALVSLGVLPRRPDRDALARRERARGFADSGFAPDPFR